MSPTPYVIDGQRQQVVNTVVSNTTTILEADSHGVGLQPLGSAPYTILLFCPSLTQFYGDGTNLPTSTKFSGVSILQTSDLNLPLSLGDMLMSSKQHTMDKIYGGDASSISTGAMAWAATMTARFVTQKIGQSGDAFFGSFPLSCFHTESGQPATITINDMIRTSNKTVSIKQSLVLNNHVRNRQLITKKSNVSGS